MENAADTNVGDAVASKVPDKPLKDVRAGVTEKTIDILASYRKNFSMSHPQGQLVLPENMKEFSAYILGLLKSRAFKGMSKGPPSPVAGPFWCNGFCCCMEQGTNS